MPPKRRAPGKAPAARAPAPRRSRLAKEHNCSAAHEAEIRTAWALFSASDPSASTSKKKGSASADDLSDTVIPTRDVRKCLIALNAPPSSKEELAEIVETLDPESNGSVAWEHFFAVAVMKVQSRFEDEEMEDEEGEGDGAAGLAEVRAAFRLFTRDEGQVITLAHLRRVARELREEVDEKTLRDMIREANGEGKASGATVGIEEFADVMRRAGVFG
ncbi:hypothetical protein K461DRAFT_297701 [Myriangium duriaei CBS 260.36]|uniref:Calmodulin n=1 Tax=Myriangium duriaei CBS 260.36 TaxID=1168546 RepID=A0A9P4ITV4_9PEZI|nr:hypothetical protein K461DRAFT_297701 [Myriangium duriaei CBS 260.36]